MSQVLEDAAPPTRHERDHGDTLTTKSMLRWTDDLHARFLAAVECLGGPLIAKPKEIVDAMQVDGLQLMQVKSHLQKHRRQLGAPTGSGRGERGAGGGGPKRPRLGSDSWEAGSHSGGASDGDALPLVAPAPRPAAPSAPKPDLAAPAPPAAAWPEQAMQPWQTVQSLQRLSGASSLDSFKEDLRALLVQAGGPTRLPSGTPGDGSAFADAARMWLLQQQQQQQLEAPPLLQQQRQQHLPPQQQRKPAHPQRHTLPEDGAGGGDGLAVCQVAAQPSLAAPALRGPNLAVLLALQAALAEAAGAQAGGAHPVLHAKAQAGEWAAPGGAAGTSGRTQLVAAIHSRLEAQLQHQQQVQQQVLDSMAGQLQAVQRLQHSVRASQTLLESIRSLLPEGGQAPGKGRPPVPRGGPPAARLAFYDTHPAS